MRAASVAGDLGYRLVGPGDGDASIACAHGEADVVQGEIRKDAPPAQLYNLETDPYQTKNVHNERLEVVAELSALLKSWQAEIPKTRRLGWINLRQDLE